MKESIAKHVVKPSVGRIVLYVEGDLEQSHIGGRHYRNPNHSGTNNTRIHPAIITRVWSDTCVNLHVLFDAHASEVRTSVARLDTPADTHNPNSGWRWPERV